MDFDDHLHIADVAVPASDASARSMPRTFQDLVNWVQEQSGWPEQRRAVAVSQLRSLAWILVTGAAEACGRLTPVTRSEVVLSAVRCDVAWVNDHLTRFSRRRFRMTRGSFSNLLGTFRKAMIAHGLAEVDRCGDLPADSEWDRLLRGCTQYDRLAIKRLAVWCQRARVAPSGLNDAALGRFRSETHERLVVGSAHKLVQRSVVTWNKLVQLGLTGTAASVLAAPRRRQPYVRPPSAYGPSYVAQFEALKALMEGRGRTRPRRRSDPPRLKPRSIDTYLFGIQQAMSAYARLRPDSSPPRLADLLDGDTFDQILCSFYQRARLAAARKTGADPDGLPEEVGVTAQTESIAKALLWVARNSLKLSEATIADLRDRASAFRPKREHDIHPKVRGRLDLLAEPSARARLLHLPRRLLRIAGELKESRPERAALMAMTAAAIEIELFCPLRIENLTQLALDENVVRASPGSRRIVRLRVPAHQAKNHRLLDWQLDSDAAHLVQRYIDEFRPLRASPDNRWLFPGCIGSDRSRSVSAMSSAIVREVDYHVGVRINPHLFRAFVACLRLELDPGAVNDIRLLLGHSEFGTTLKYYAYVQPKTAAVRHGAVMARARNSLHPLVKRWIKDDKHV